MQPVKYVVGVVTVVLGAMFAPAARGDGRSDLKAGIQRYEQGDLRRAASALRTATRTISASRERGRAWFYLGLTLGALHGPKAARRAFEIALTHDPEVTPDRLRVHPALLAELATVRRTVVGDLSVAASEARARVLVGGKERGKTPLTVRLPVGRYALQVISADGYRGFEASPVLIRARKTTVANVRLHPRLGRLRLLVFPTGASVYEGKRVVTRPSSRSLTLAAGPHRLKVQSPGYLPATRQVVVEPNETLELRVSLRRAPPPWYRSRRMWGLISVGLSAAATGAGLLVGWSARSAEEELRNGERNGTLSLRQFKELAASADSRALAANILLGAAGAAAVTGLILLFIGDQPTKPEPRAWNLVPSAGGAAFAVRF